MDHPLSPVSADEIKRAVEIVGATGRISDTARFAYVGLHEPDKAAVKAFRPGDPIERALRAVIVTGPSSTLIEAVVSVTKGEVLEWDELADAYLHGKRPSPRRGARNWRAT